MRGLYAGCVWLFVAAWLAIAAYWGLGIAGPSALPTVITFIALAVLAVALAIAITSAAGGRKVAAASMILGLVLASLNIVLILGSRSDPASAVPGSLLCLAIVLSSAFAYRYGYRSQTGRTGD